MDGVVKKTAKIIHLKKKKKKKTYQSAIFHSFASLVYNEFSVPKQWLGIISKPEMDDAEVILKILDVSGFY